MPRDYGLPFSITDAVGNNAFSFDRRGPAPSLWVPSLVPGTFDDVAAGDRVVFEDVDEHDTLQSCTGLAHLVDTHWDGVPTVVMDNHNHAFYFWQRAVTAGAVAPLATLIHIDQHKDMRVPEHLYDGHTFDDAFAYTNFHLNVGNYIVPAQKCGLVGEVQFVTSGEALNDESLATRGNTILNIDLDFFAPEMSYIDFDRAHQFIDAHRRTASLITIATSPFFIDQERAIERLRRLVGGAEK
ncbi:MAG: UPF0489 family protein [Acidobacteriota bacterium]